MNEIAKTSRAVQTTAVQQVLVPRTFDQLVTFAEMAAVSGMVPRDYVNKPGAVMIAVQMGSELGLSPMQSITSIAVIGNRAAVFGDALIGLCRQSPLCQDIVETIDGEGDARTATCVATRRGATPTVVHFSVADAKKAALWGKSGPWTQYPDRMLQHRARGFALRDAFPDVLRGLKTVEELRDTPPDTFHGTTLEATPEVTPPPANVPKKRYVRDWLADLRATLAACHTVGEIDAIAGDDKVVKALSGGEHGLKNGALFELNAILAEAIDRVNAAEMEAQEAAVDEDASF